MDFDLAAESKPYVYEVTTKFLIVRNRKETPNAERRGEALNKREIKNQTPIACVEELLWTDVAAGKQSQQAWQGRRWKGKK